MYKSYDMENGIGPTIYRSPCEVAEDVRYIKRKIKEVSATLNLRDMLLNILSGERLKEPELLISTLSDAIEEAKETLFELKELEQELHDLEDELREVKWITGC